MMPQRRRRFWFVFAMLALIPLIGCEQPAVETGPSYAELVVTYNAELEALDRLEVKRDTLIKDYAMSVAAKAPGDTLSKLQGLLKSARDVQVGTDVDATSDPDALLDSLTERRGEAHEIADQLLGGLLGEAPSEPEPNLVEDAAAEERKSAYEAELANLDAEITKQQERVERARQARDAAEAKSPKP